MAIQTKRKESGSVWESLGRHLHYQGPSITDSGAESATEFTDGAISGTAFTSASAAFTAIKDVGKVVIIYVDLATTITGGGTVGSSSITLASLTGLAAGRSIVIDGEYITVARSYAGTNPVPVGALSNAHANGASVKVLQAPFATTFSAYVSPTAMTMADAAPNALTARVGAYGIDCTSAIINAVLKYPSVYIPRGIFLTTANVTFGGITMHGDGQGVSIIWQTKAPPAGALTILGGGNGPTAWDVLTIGGSNTTLKDVTLRGPAGMFPGFIYNGLGQKGLEMVPTALAPNTITNILVDSVTVEQVQVKGIQVWSGVNNWTMKHIRVTDTGDEGIYSTVGNKGTYGVDGAGKSKLDDFYIARVRAWAVDTNDGRISVLNGTIEYCGSFGTAPDPAGTTAQQNVTPGFYDSGGIALGIGYDATITCHYDYITVKNVTVSNCIGVGMTIGVPITAGVYITHLHVSDFKVESLDRRRMRLGLQTSGSGGNLGGVAYAVFDKLSFDNVCMTLSQCYHCTVSRGHFINASDITVHGPSSDPGAGEWGLPGGNDPNADQPSVTWGLAVDCGGSGFGDITIEHNEFIGWNRGYHVMACDGTLTSNGNKCHDNLIGGIGGSMAGKFVSSADNCLTGNGMGVTDWNTFIDAYNASLAALPTWSGGTTYAINAKVQHLGVAYISNIASNAGHTPASSPAQWSVLPVLAHVVGYDLAMLGSVASKINALNGIDSLGGDHDRTPGIYPPVNGTGSVGLPGHQYVVSYAYIAAFDTTLGAVAGPYWGDPNAPNAPGYTGVLFTGLSAPDTWRTVKEGQSLSWERQEEILPATTPKTASWNWKMRLTEKAWLGVGVPTGLPVLAPLHIRGTDTVLSDIVAVFDSATSTIGSHVNFTNALYNYCVGMDLLGNLLFTQGKYSAAAGTEHMRLTHDGFLGIADYPGNLLPGIAPAQIIHAMSANATGTSLRLQNTTTSAKIWDVRSTGSGDVAAAGGLAFYDATSAVVRAFLDTAGKFGIGTATPAYNLDVVGTGNISSDFGVGGNLSVTGNVGIATTPAYALDVLGAIRNRTAGDASPFTMARLWVYGGTSVDTSNWGYLAYGSDASMRVVFAKTGSGAPLLFGTTSAADNTGSFTELMRITTAGNVGILNNNPSYPLDVVGIARISGNLGVGGNLVVTGNTTLNGTLTLTTAALTALATALAPLFPANSIPQGSINGLATALAGKAAHPHTHTGTYLAPASGTPQALILSNDV
jgi:hypothetical protein